MSLTGIQHYGYSFVIQEGTPENMLHLILCKDIDIHLINYNTAGANNNTHAHIQSRLLNSINFGTFFVGYCISF